MVDKQFCMSSYLMYRYVYDSEKAFSEKKSCRQVDLNFNRLPVKDKDALYKALKYYVDEACLDGKAALALSGGIDSAILARLVPEGTKAYTFRCVVPGVKVIDESESAKRWADMNNLNHEIIDITWEDIVLAADKCMYHKGSPIHSIEAQIYIAATKAVGEGKTKFILGENADIIYGGMNGLLAKDWLYHEFVDRYTYVMPYRVLRNPVMPLEPYKEYEIDGHIDGHDFINKYFRQEALGTYTNACETAGIKFIGPYSLTYLDAPIDYARIRSGDTKYVIRELFRYLYPGVELPAKIPMPRPVNEWFADWKGPVRAEFVPYCTDDMTGDQKWMIWCLERYLNMIEETSYE
ncbi:asparagine synthase-related protein [Pseudobutyrivibrio xylanivorans]|uniref:Asparagine synthase n=1 Tax=Pseudobutyrivibrio xylanivorans TaxID=185007 RepID=A0A5P6VT24_PSEXY|nr:asparagine synthase C-terminal domain-containing protein [Pseudobutyrivibrio xylanivorans]QFJ55855.1 asparagine synthase [Pseudobutyrivibrio xylanivorans]